MATFTSSTDYRRTDQRTTVLENPFWITSAIFDVAVITSGKAGVLFSFPTAGRIYIVQQVIAQTVTTLVGVPTVNIGYGTIATDATPATITYSFADDYIKTGDQSSTAGVLWGPTTGTGSVFLTALLAQSYAAGTRVIVGATSTTPVVFAAIGGTATSGTARLHMLITIVPGT